KKRVLLSNLPILEGVCQGATNQEIAEAAGLEVTYVDKGVTNLGVKLNAPNRNALVWRAYQAGLVEAAISRSVPPVKYADKLNDLAARNSGAVAPLNRSTTERASVAHEYERLIVDLLRSPDFAVYHPRLAAYCQDRHAYDTNQWRNLISKFGSPGLGIINLKTHGPRKAAYGMSLVPKAMLANGHKAFINGRASSAYHSATHGYPPQNRFDDDHLPVSLTPEVEGALSPWLQAMIGLSSHIIQGNIIESDEQGYRTWRYITAKPIKELAYCLHVLRERGHVERDGSFGKLTESGREVMFAGLKRARSEVGQL
ncbi:MAG TPA: hypothetical protein VIJ68_00275, partial [Candidatus Saccharimonadales bacterium]